MSRFILIRSFNRAAEACARLGYFGAANKRPTTDEGNYFESLSNSLAHDDLIEFAVAARRLAEVGDFNKQARQRKVPLLRPVQTTPTKWKLIETGKKLDLYQLMDQLIHSSLFEVVSNDYTLKSLLGEFKGDILEEFQAAKYKSEFKPIILLRTKKTPIVMVSIEDVVMRSMTFLDHVSDELSEKDIWLGNHKYDAD